MSLLDIHAASIQRNARAWAANPGPAIEPSFSLFAVPGDLLSSMKAGGMEALAITQDVLAPADRQTARARKPKALQDQPTRAPNILSGGGASRRTADEFMPDPLTAHTANQMLAGLGKTVTKAAAAMTLGGPTGGAIAFGGLEAGDTAARLQEKGVDPTTAWQVGGVVGAVSAIGARLPVTGEALAIKLAGPTVGMVGKAGATAGLATAGGPLSYMAQEKLSRDILQAGGYNKEAELHDPTNPVGLAASMFPFVLGGGALAIGARRAARARALDDPQAAAEAALMDPDRLPILRAEAAKPDTPPKERAKIQKQIDAIEAKLKADAAADPELDAAARVAVLDQTVAASLPDHPNAHAELKRAMDAVAAGERVDASLMLSRAESDLAYFEAQAAALREQHASLLADMSSRAEPGAVREARQELALMEQTRVDASEAAIKARAKEIQAADGVSYKTALSTAKKEIGALANDWEAKSQRINSFLEANAKAAKAEQEAARIQRAIDEFDGKAQEARAQVEAAAAAPREAADATNALPPADQVALKPEPPAKTEAAPAANAPDSVTPRATDSAPQGKPRDLKAEVIALRKTRALLTKLQECLA